MTLEADMDHWFEYSVVTPVVLPVMDQKPTEGEHHTEYHWITEHIVIM